MECEAKELLALFGQEHLIDDLSQFSAAEMAGCILQLKRWKIEETAMQRASWKQREARQKIEPFCDPGIFESGSSSRRSAALFLAGGQGSRLGFDGPKGCYPLLGKTLFQRHAEKIRKDAPVAILTSRLNHHETTSFFEQQSYFGLKKLSFFSQDTLPLLDEAGKWFWMAPGKIAEGPDGNGSVFAAMERAGILRRFAEEKVETIHVVPVDNPLADPFDPQLAAFHEASGADLSLKCIRLEDPAEPMGRLVRIEGRLAIAEFAELTEEERLQNRYANTALLAIDLSLAKLLAKKNFPLHWAWRSTPAWRGEKRFAWKAERFIVDALAFAEKARALFCSKESCYAPLKEKKSIGEIERLLVV